MTVVNKKVYYDQRLVDAEVKTTEELHPSNRNGAIKIRGALTSPIQLRGGETKEPYYYAFVRLKGQSIDLPVIFKVKGDNKLVKPKLKEHDEAELTGNYSNSPQSIRKSFTCIDYCKLGITKKCVGCGEKFFTTKRENYDYCVNCRGKENNGRYKEENIFVKHA